MKILVFGAGVIGAAHAWQLSLAGLQCEQNLTSCDLAVIQSIYRSNRHSLSCVRMHQQQRR